MKLNPDFLSHDTGDEKVLVATGSAAFSGILRANRTAAFIVDTLAQPCTREELVAALLERYDVKRETAEADVDRILETLRSVGAIIE